MRILYVGGDQRDGAALRRQLRKMAPQSALKTLATEGKAIVRLEKCAPPPDDVLLTQISLPDGMGFALLRFVRHYGFAAGRGGDHRGGGGAEALAALEAGADDYVMRRRGLPGGLPQALVDMAHTLRPDVVVADIAMPLLNGIKAAWQLRTAQPDAKIIVLTMHADVAYAVRAFEAGAVGYVLKHAASAELLTAIREALQGHVYVAPQIATGVFQSIVARPCQGPSPRLTSRQREVLRSLAEGHSAKQIAALLHISRRTAEFHKYRIMELLGLRTQAELVRYAIKHGMTSV
jgi:DNA-binding NarL/FixJ family response regulator